MPRTRIEEAEKKYRQAQKLLPRGTNYIDPSPSQTISCHELAVSCLYWKGEKKMLRTLPVVNHQLTLEKTTGGNDQVQYEGW